MKTEENVLYTDGHEVTVTETGLHVRRQWYSLSGITKHGFVVIPPVKLYSFGVIVVGTLLITAGIQGYIPGKVSDFYGVELPISTLAIFGGSALLALGIWMLLSLTERFALSITTAEGERNVIVSKKREYIAMIVGALNEATFQKLKSGDEKALNKREFQVSSR